LRKYLLFILTILLSLALLGCSNEGTDNENNTKSWKESSTFEVNNQVMYGKKGKFGIFKENGYEPEPEFIAGKQGRLYGVYFWGDEELVGKKYRMEATYQDNGETKTLYRKEITENNHPSIEADAQSGAKFGFDEDEAGLWRIDVMVDDELYASFVIRVEKP